MFVMALSAVLMVGGTVMVGYAAFVAGQSAKNMQGNSHEMIDLSWLFEQPDTKEQTDENMAAEGTADENSDEIQTSGVYDEILAENERLYQDAVEKGENVRVVECADSERVSFLFAGDILLDDEYAMMFRYRSRGSDIYDTFTGGLLERMQTADVFMLNNEFPFSTRGAPTEGKQFTFRANPANVELLGQIGVDVVSLANNHAYDYGEEALLDTFTTLENAGIPYVGAGRNIEDAKKPLYLIANGMKIGIVSATQIERNAVPDTKEATSTNAGVLRCMDPSALLEVIAETKANCDFVILYIHWGTESQEETDWLQDKQAPIYAEAGVNLIIGDHPHCLQKIDVVSGVPVVYSLGNYWFNSKTQDTCLVEVGINKDGIQDFRFVACRQEDCRTRELEGSDKEGVLNYMRGLSPNIQIDSEGGVTF
ncbi:MAG: CapA family protein [Lachnospiraceae bacterium]|nr:CapA family protein [Lachnospiraceae bacterium]